MFLGSVNRGGNIPDPHDIHPKILQGARRSGVVNLNNRGLSYVPKVIWSLNSVSAGESDMNFGSNENDDLKWWETEPITRLNLFGNSIEELPNDSIAQLDSLVNLDVRDNHLTSLPDRISELENLKQLLLSSNRITQLPPSLTQLSALVVLDLAHNQLTSLPDDLANLTALEKLDVSDNQLHVAPASLPPLLSSLNISQNRLPQLPDGWVQSCRNLREFDASNNDLVSAGITAEPQLPNLTTLALHRNHLPAVPDLRAFPLLKEVSLGDNKILSLPLEAFQGLHDLATLELSRNRIAEIPAGIPEALPALARLDLSNNDIKYVQTDLGFMDSLNVLALTGNPLRSIPQNALTSGTQFLKELLRDRHNPAGSNVTNSTNNNASNSASPPSKQQQQQQEEEEEDASPVIQTHPYDGLPAVVPITGVLQWGKETRRPVGANRFAVGQQKGDANDELPPLDDEATWRRVALKGVTGEASVRNLVLSGRQLEVFPRGIFAFTDTLVRLDLSVNRIPALPEEISNLKRLEELILTNNALKSLPSSLPQLASLRILVLDSNPGLGPTIPPDILLAEPMSRGLQELSISGCQLTSHPPAELMTPEKMPHLQSLDISNNCIASLQPELGLCKQLQNLRVTGNTFRFPRPNVVAKGTEAILEYMASKINQ